MAYEPSDDVPFKDRSAYGKEVKHLGEGAYGFVSLSVTSKNVGYAIKTVPTPSDYYQKVTREAGYMIRLDHPNILKVYDVIFSKYYFDIVLQYASKGTLLDQKGITSLMKKNYAYQLLCGIAYCHSRDIVHRDIKPANVLIDSHDVVKIADFGLASAFTCEGHYTAAVSYTVPYRAPEIFLGGVYSMVSDIWAIACTIYELFTEKMLFKTSNFSEKKTLEKIMSLYADPLKAWPGIRDMPDYDPTRSAISAPYRDLRDDKNLCPDIASILIWMLQLNPAERPQASQVLKHPFFDAVRKKEYENVGEYTCLEKLYMRDISARRTTLSPVRRRNLFGQIAVIFDAIKSPTKTLCLTFVLIDFLAKKKIKKKELLINGCACLNIASVYCEDQYPISIPELSRTSEIPVKSLSEEIMRVARELKYDFLIVTAADYIYLFLDEYPHNVGKMATTLIQISYFMDISFGSHAKDIALVCLMMACVTYNWTFKHTHLVPKKAVDIYNKILEELASEEAMGRFKSRDYTPEDVKKYIKILKESPIKVT